MARTTFERWVFQSSHSVPPTTIRPQTTCVAEITTLVETGIPMSCAMALKKTPSETEGVANIRSSAGTRSAARLSHVHP